MPHLLKRCATPGCDNKVPWGHRRCTDCKRRRRRQYDRGRPTAAARGYGYGWQRKARQYVDAHRECVDCGARSELPHHLIPKADGGPDEDWNLVPVCAACHARRERAESLRRQRDRASR